MRVTALALCLLLAGCSKLEKPVILAVPAQARGAFADALHAGLVKAAADEGFTVRWPSEGGEPVPDSSHAGVVIWNAGAPPETSVLQRAAAARVPVIVVEAAEPDGQYLSLVAPAYERAGRRAAQRLADLLEGTGVAGILGAGSTATAAALERGFTTEMRQSDPGIRLLPAAKTSADRAAALAAADTYRRGNPDMTGLFALDEASSAAIAQNLRANGISQIRVAAFRATSLTIDDLRDRFVDVIIVDNAMRMGVEAVRTIARARRGESVPKRVEVPFILVDRGNMENPDSLEVLYPDVQRWLTPHSAR